MLREKAEYYYGELGLNCAEGILKAAGDVYGLNITDEEVSLFKGFGKGYGCGITCGALSASIGILGRLYPDKSKDEMHEICAGMVKAFEEKLGDTLCAPLEAKNKTPENRCLKTVAGCADVLEAYIDKLEGKTKPAPVCEDSCTLTPEQIKRVKGLGFLQHKGTNKFNGRIITRNGRITKEEMQTISEAAALYGDGYIMLTTRLTVEVSGIDYDDIDDFIAYVGKAGLLTGGTGSKVRPVVACKAATCQYGLYDAYDLSEKIHERFYVGYHDINLPHKFKIALGGCPNNCVKPNLNDLGIVGACVPNFNADLCKGCKKCQIEANCPIHIAHVEDGKLCIDPGQCNNCGRCVGKCPFKCIESGSYGWKIYIGGRWGKKYVHGKMLPKIFTDEKEVLDTVEKTILFFRREGKTGERLAETIERIGFEKSADMIMNGDLLERKNEILGLNVKGGASC